MAVKRPARDSTQNSNTTLKTSDKSSSNVHHSPRQIVWEIWYNYNESTTQRTKMIDVYMAFLIVVGVFQFIYCIIAGNYPFNAFLSGFSSAVGQFVLTASLRIQTNDKNKTDFIELSSERAFADYVFGSLILHFFCINFIN